MSTTAQDARPNAEAPMQSGMPRRNPALRGPILLATDGATKNGSTAVTARLVARHLNVPLEVVTVLEPQPSYGVAFGEMPVYVPEVDEARRDARFADVLDYIEKSAAGDVPRVHIMVGSTTAGITEVARDRNATLVVVGAAPHQRANRIIGGERAALVLRSSSVPVMSVAPGLDALPRRVVVAVDFSPASVRAAQTALLVIQPGGMLTLVHVIEPPLGDAPLRDPDGHDPADAIQTLFDRLREELRPYVPEGVTIETLVTTDVDIDGILATAAEADADLIAVGTHGPRLLERIFLGSVASSILHTAPQTVLAAPPPPAGEALDLWRRITQTATTEQPTE